MSTFSALATARRSKYLFQWEAADLSLAARAGQVGTYTRNDTQSVGVIDSNGVYGPALPNQPRFIGVTGNDGVRCVASLSEPARSKLVQRNCAMATSPWATTGTAPTNAADVGPGFSASLMGAANASTTNQSVTYTGNAVKAFAIRVKQSVGHTGTAFHLVKDTTAGVNRLKLQSTFNADGSVTFAIVGGVGVLLATNRLANGYYEALCQTTSVTAANTNKVYASDGSGSSGTCTQFLCALVETEDATAPSSPIVTAGSTGSRVQDLLTWPFAALPQALTMYAKYVELAPIAGETHRILRIGNVGTSIANLVRTSGNIEFETGGLDGDTGVNLAVSNPAYGDVVELCGSWSADASTPSGGAVLSVSSCVNGGAITTATGTGSRLPATWTDAHVSINELGAEDSQRPHAFISARIAAGVQTLTQMRSTT